MLSSLQCGLAAVPADADAVMFAPVDHPHLQTSTLEALALEFQAARAPVTVPVYARRARASGMHFARAGRRIAGAAARRQGQRRDPSPRRANVLFRSGRSGRRHRYRRSGSLRRVDGGPRIAASAMKALRRWILIVLLAVLAAGALAPFLQRRPFRGRASGRLGSRAQSSGADRRRASESFHRPWLHSGRVVIDDDPAAGMEPFAHVESMQARVRLDAACWRASSHSRASTSTRPA